MTPEEQLQQIAKTWTLAQDKRICAVCLEEIDRASYNQHMSKDHGYQILEIVQVDKLPESKK